MKAIFLDIDGALNTPSSESRCGEYIGIDDEKVEKLNDEQSSILLREENGKEFLAAIGEDLESVRPDYNFKETQNALDAVNMNQTLEIDL